MIHANSIASYHSQPAKLSKRAQDVLEWIALHGPRTDREIAYGMGYGENLNAVRPRITELVESHKLMEVCNRKCPVTGKTVRVVDIQRAKQGSLFPRLSHFHPAPVEAVSDAGVAMGRKALTC